MYLDTILYVRSTDRFRRLLWVPVFVLGVPLLGVGVPVAWVWIASHLQGDLANLGALPAAVLVLGIPATYCVLTLLAHRARRPGRSAPPRRRVEPWNRSESERRESGSALEALFVTTTVLVAVAADIYLVFFDHPGVPAGP
jgi:hypothetical protein